MTEQDITERLRAEADWLNDVVAGVAIRRHNPDGTVDRIDPADFYIAKPETTND